MHVTVTMLANNGEVPLLAFNKELIIQPDGEDDTSYLLDVTNAVLQAVDEGRASIAQQASRMGVQLTD